MYSLVIEQFACAIVALYRCLNIRSDYGGDDFLTIDPAEVPKQTASDEYV